MLNWLRTKLRSWLMIDTAFTAANHRMDDIERGCKGMADQWNAAERALNTAIVEQGKSFQKQVKELGEIDGTQLTANSVAWQPTKLGGAIADLRNRVKKLEPVVPSPLADALDGCFVGLASGKSTKKKPRTKAKKGR